MKGTQSTLRGVESLRPFYLAVWLCIDAGFAGSDLHVTTVVVETFNPSEPWAVPMAIHIEPCGFVEEREENIQSSKGALERRQSGRLNIKVQSEEKTNTNNAVCVYGFDSLSILACPIRDHSGGPLIFGVWLISFYSELLSKSWSHSSSQNHFLCLKCCIVT